MLKIPRRRSVILSLALAVVFMLVLIAVSVFMKDLVRIFVDMRYPDQPMVGERLFILIVGRLIIALCMLADVLLFFLLRRVWLGEVFTPQSVAFVRALSWCAVLVGLLFGLLGWFFKIAFVVAFVGVFLGLCVRVVKNVIEEATAIKAENDLTV